MQSAIRIEAAAHQRVAIGLEEGLLHLPQVVAGTAAQRAVDVYAELGRAELSRLGPFTSGRRTRSAGHGRRPRNLRHDGCSLESMANVEETQAETVVVEPAATSTTPLAAPVSEAPSNLRWGAVVGGTVAALGIAALLYSLGLALGLSSIDPRDPGSVRPSGIFTGVWALAVSLVALFVGGFVAARGAGALTRMAGSLHGLVMWGLTVVVGMWLIGTVVSGLLSGAAAMGRTAAEVIREGSGADAKELAARIERRAAEARRESTQRLAETREDALSAAENTGKAFWGVFGALLLGMLAAIGGALVGSAKGGRRRPRTVVRDRPAPRIEHREVYP